MTLTKRDRPTELLSAHRLFQTRDVDRARSVVSQKFCAHDLVPGSSHRVFETRHNHAAGLSLSLNYLRYGCDIWIDPGELDSFYLVQIPIAGTAMVENGLKQVDASPQTGTVLNATRATRMKWSKGCEKLLLQIDREALHRTAEMLTGQLLNDAVVFDPEVHLKASTIRRWMSKVRAATKVAQCGGAFGANMHRHQTLLEEDLISGFLYAQKSSISHMLEECRAMPSIGELRRARSFISENLTNPITVSDISRAAGCSVRSLQAGFQQQFGCSPMRYLTRQRLNHAHHLLQTRPADTRVSSIAYDVGFTHLGRFATAYRSSFGQSPRDTWQMDRSPSSAFCRCSKFNHSAPAHNDHVRSSRS